VAVVVQGAVVVVLAVVAVLPLQASMEATVALGVRAQDHSQEHNPPQRRSPGVSAVLPDVPENDGSVCLGLLCLGSVLGLGVESALATPGRS